MIDITVKIGGTKEIFLGKFQRPSPVEIAQQFLTAESE